MPPVPSSEDSRRVEGHCALFKRQLRVLLLKNFIILIRHPVFLVLMLFYPAVLITFLSGASTTKPVLRNEYPITTLHGFATAGKKIAYYPKSNKQVELMMNFLLESHQPPLPQDVLLGFETEREAAEYFVTNPNDIIAAFSFDINSYTYDHIDIQYYWRVNRYYSIGNPDPSEDAYYDPFRAERLANLAIIRFLLSTSFAPKLEVIAKEQALIHNAPTDRQLVKAFDLLKKGRVKVVNNITYTWFPDFEWYSQNDFFNPIVVNGGVLMGLMPLFLIYFFCFQMVYEKESKLRQSLHTVGMLDSTYLLSYAIVGFIVSIATGFMSALVGVLTLSEFWLNTPFLATWYTITMYHFSVLSVCIFFISLLPKAQAIAFIAFTATFILSILGFIHSTPQRFFPEGGSFTVFYLLPFLHSLQSLLLMSLRAYSFPYNNTLHNPAKFFMADLATFTGVCEGSVCGSQSGLYDSGHTVLFHMLITPLLCLCYWLLAAYMDLLLPYAHGSRLNFWMPFTLEFWGCFKTPSPPDSHKPNYEKPPKQPVWDEDVAAEQDAVLAPLGSALYSQVADSPVLIYDMNVTYGGCYKRENTCALFCGRPVKHAVKNLSLSIPRNSVYGLLGPNGAGKSTTLSVLTGTLKPTSGYVTVEGYSITHQRQKVSQLISYAPQFDILWPDMTPAEHIKFFCDMRGVNYSEDLKDLKRRREMASEDGVLFMNDFCETYFNDALKKKGCCSSQIERKKNRLTNNSIEKNKIINELIMLRLQIVGLQESANFQAKNLSGGMRRRLTVALSLIGDIRVIFMDEASTGLDPISKRKLWDAIHTAKYKRSIIITTHSMEECEALADKVGIIADGCLRCNNTLHKLKKKYGIGYRLDMEVHPDDVLRVRDEIVNLYCSAAVLISRIGGALTLAIPKGAHGKGLEDMLNKIATSDWVLTWSIRQTTMEEIFLTVVNIDKYNA